MGFELTGLDEGALGGAGAEEAGVNRGGEGGWRGEEGGYSFPEVPRVQVMEN